MIVSGTQPAEANRATLDDLFRRSGVRHPDTLALVDPPNAESITGNPPRRLTYTQADRAISAFAATLRGLGLQTDTVVAMQLANTVDSVVALLGGLRAGMIAAPLPLLWRKQEMVAAISHAGAKAIVTSARIGSAAHAEIAMQVAAELFPIRHICGFGRDLPDGVMPLDHVFGSGTADYFQPSMRSGNAAAHIAAITFDGASDGLVPVMHNHDELIAGGRAAFQEGGLAEDATMLSSIALGSFAGIALTMVPWLLEGGTLALHHGFDPAVFAEQCCAQEILTVVLPGPALMPLSDAGLLGGGIKNILALWRSPEQLAAATPWPGNAAVLDIASFGETELASARRGPDGRPTLIPQGALAAPSGVTTVGFYRLRQCDVDAAVAAVDPAAVIVALPDALLGQRLAGTAHDLAATAAGLQARGVNSLIAGAFRPRGSASAA